jgi:hypothetical protein
MLEPCGKKKIKLGTICKRNGHSANKSVHTGGLYKQISSYWGTLQTNHFSLLPPDLRLRPRMFSVASTPAAASLSRSVCLPFRSSCPLLHLPLAYSRLLLAFSCLPLVLEDMYRVIRPAWIHWLPLILGDAVSLGIIDTRLEETSNIPPQDRSPAKSTSGHYQKACCLESCFELLLPSRTTPGGPPKNGRRKWPVLSLPSFQSYPPPSFLKSWSIKSKSTKTCSIYGLSFHKAARPLPAVLLMVSPVSPVQR